METYLSIEGLSEYLGIADKTLRKWVLNREIPFQKIKKIIRFRLSEIEKWIDTGCKLPVLNENEIFEEGDLFADDEPACEDNKVLEIAEDETGEA